MPYIEYTKKAKDNARNLRKDMTRQEKHLWYDFLSKYPVRFNRQKPLGYYIADFYSYDAKLVIELDGSQHFSEDGLEYDKIRTEILEKNNLKVIRFTNIDIDKHFNSVCQAIDLCVKEQMNYGKINK